MIKFGTDYSKLKTTLRLACTRLKLLQSKKLEQNEKLKSEVANSLKKGKYFQARIEVQKIIKEAAYVEAMELLKMYCEEVLVKYDLFQQSKQPDITLLRPISSLIWVTPYYQAQIQELGVIGRQLAVKYGPRFNKMALKNQEESVDPELIDRVKMFIVSDESIENYLKKICFKYGITYDKKDEIVKDNSDDTKHCECKTSASLNQEKRDVKLNQRSEDTNKKNDKISKMKGFFDIFGSKASKRSEESPDEAVSSTSNKNGVISNNVSDSFDGILEENQQIDQKTSPLTLEENNNTSLEYDFSLNDHKNQIDGIKYNVSENICGWYSRDDEIARGNSLSPTAPPTQIYIPVRHPIFEEPPPPYNQLYFNNISSKIDFNNTTNECFDSTELSSSSIHLHLKCSSEDISVKTKTSEEKES